MLAAYALFVLSGLFAVGAIIAQRRKRKRDESQPEKGPPRSEPDRLPSIVELSNHGAHLLAEVERKRQTSEDAIHKNQAALKELKIDEAKIKSGVAGEAKLDAFFREQFCDGWTIIAGYRAHEGEIDRILVGPKGVFAFEVKNLGGVIHCDGDRWWRDKTDRRGNVIERDIPIVDNGGRSPSRQINDAADALERLLRENGHHGPVVRVIVFTHPRTAFGNIKNLSADILGMIPGLNTGKLLDRGKELPQDDARRIVTMIRRHHEWFERKERQSARYDETLSQVFLPSL